MALTKNNFYQKKEVKEEEVKKPKKLKVVGVHWHTAHQHELAKLPFFECYDFIINPYRKWADTYRPYPKNSKEIPFYTPGKYDLAILHVDQQTIFEAERGNSVKKGRLYKELNETIQDIPKIVINHMTPFHDKYSTDRTVDIIKKLVGDNHMIVNSHEAKKQWGWGHTIIHGMDIEEWVDLPKEPRCIVSLSKGGMEKAYRRTFLRAVIDRLEELNVPIVWIGNDRKFNNFKAYRDFIGSSLVYLHPAWQSPMPRARTEAMLSGACIVTTPYQDADTFIEDGVNGFLTSKVRITDPRVMDNPEYTANLIKRLVVDEPELAIKIGQAGKKTAQKLFCKENFTRQWKEYLTEIGVL